MAKTAQGLPSPVLIVLILTASLVQASTEKQKRNAQSPDNHDILVKRAAFSAWAGKRNTQDSHTTDSETRDKVTGERESTKNSVSSETIWRSMNGGGGEQNDEEKILPSAPLNDNSVFATDRVQAPSSWGGYSNTGPFSSQISDDADLYEPQRPSYPLQQLDNDNKDLDSPGAARYDADVTKESSLAKKSAFSPWSGKRSSYDDGVVAKRPAFNSWGGKRSPDNVAFETDTDFAHSSADDSKRAAFSAWAGKRSTVLELLDEHAKRAAFSSWAGKRAGRAPPRGSAAQPSQLSEKRPADSASAEGDKRAAFSVWAGKRADKTGSSADRKRSPFNAWAGRRKRQTTAFSAWAGKRDSGLMPAPQTRAAFNVWAGKRDSGLMPAPQTRAAFNVWAGKRDSSLTPALQRRASFSAWAGKRALRPSFLMDYDKKAFSAWAGKRSATGDVSGAVEDAHHVEKRATFNAWAGKRAAFSAWGGKRALFPVRRRNSLPWFLWSGKRAPFNAWAGKRSYPAAADYVLTKRDPFSPWSGKRGVQDDPEKRAAFSAWAGKRVYDIFDDEDDLRSASPFSGWAGRAPVADDAEDADVKRAAFSAWAGKRSLETLPGKPADNDDDNLQMAFVNAVDSSAADATLDSDLTPFQSIDDLEDFSDEALPTFPQSRRPSRSLLSSPDFRQEDHDAALSDFSGDVTDEDMLPSKRLWYGHLGFAPFSRWYRKRARLQKPTTALGKYLRRVLASAPIKRRFNSWAGKRSSPGIPDFGLEGER